MFGEHSFGSINLLCELTFNISHRHYQTKVCIKLKPKSGTQISPDLILNMKLQVEPDAKIQQFVGPSLQTFFQLPDLLVECIHFKKMSTLS